MARTSSLDFETVAAAAAKINARGERVTLRSVRAELGEGSLTTIQRHLADWQGSENRKKEVKVEGVELPASIARAILAEIEAARAEVEQELRGQLADLIADRDALIVEVERLREEAEQAKNDAAKAQGMAEALQEQIKQNEKARQTESDRANAQQRIAEAGAARLEAAARELDSLKASNKEAREEAKKAREEAAELRGQLVAMKEAKKPARKAPANS